MNKSMIKALLLKLVGILRQTKNYARIVGVILFALGLIGFAFRSDSSLPDVYLAASLVLGFWGIVSGLWDTGNGQTAAVASATEQRPNQTSQS